MIKLLILVALLGGMWNIQDGLASIMYYTKESWKWNHCARLARVLWGLALLILGLVLFFDV